MNSSLSAPHRALVERTELALSLGRQLFRFGASTQRIVDSMDHLFRQTGGGRLEVLVTYDAITVSASDGAESCTRVDSSQEVAGVNIHGQGEIRRMLLSTGENIRSVEYFRAQLAETASRPDLIPTYPWRWLAAGAASAGFCVFNGGDLPAAAIALVASLVVFATRFELLRRRFTVYLATLGAVCAGGLVAALFARQGWSVSPEIALVAPVLFLVPGVPMITGGIDITRNHNSVGLARIAYTLALTATIILGLALSLPLLIDLPAAHGPAASPVWTRILIDGSFGALTARRSGPSKQCPRAGNRGSRALRRRRATDTGIRRRLRNGCRWSHINRSRSGHLPRAATR